MKKTYITPTLSVIKFTTETILATSTVTGAHNQVSRQSQLSNKGSFNKGPWSEDE